MQNNHRVVFFGTPKIAQTCLQALLDKNINIVAVVTKKDTLVGRKQISTPSDVKILAQKHNIEVIEVDKLSLIANRINELQPELIITCAFGKIVPESILNIPKFRCVNVHTSLLPR
jgi:methionyl-tRNA formyltransferase